MGSWHAQDDEDDMGMEAAVNRQLRGAAAGAGDDEDEDGVLQCVPHAVPKRAFRMAIDCVQPGSASQLCLLRRMLLGVSSNTIAILQQLAKASYAMVLADEDDEDEGDDEEEEEEPPAPKVGHNGCAVASVRDQSAMT